MTALQLLLIGAMGAWTPSLIVMALLLRRVPSGKKPYPPLGRGRAVNRRRLAGNGVRGH